MSWQAPIKPCAIYRVWSASDELLYVGRSATPTARVQGHMSFQHWSQEIAKITVHWFSNRAEAAAAEIAAIQAEFPKWNIHHSISMPSRPEPFGKGRKRKAKEGAA